MGETKEIERLSPDAAIPSSILRRALDLQVNEGIGVGVNHNRRYNRHDPLIAVKRVEENSWIAQKGNQFYEADSDLLRETIDAAPDDEGIIRFGQHKSNERKLKWSWGVRK